MKIIPVQLGSLSNKAILLKTQIQVTVFAEPTTAENGKNVQTMNLY